MNAIHNCPECGLECQVHESAKAAACPKCGRVFGVATRTLTCAKHPNGLIDHTYDLTQAVLNGIPSGEGWKSNHKYHCHDCGIELLSLAEAARP